MIMVAAKKSKTPASKASKAPAKGKKKIASKAPKTSKFLDEHVIITKIKPPAPSEPRIVISGPMENNWTTGMVSVDGIDFEFAIKHYPEPSVYGIDNGCISKMTISRKGAGVVVNYDRGWDIIPQGGAVMKAYKALLDRFNSGMKGSDLKRYNQMNTGGF